MKTIVIVHHTGELGGGTKSLLDLCEMLNNNYNVIVCIPKGYPEFAKRVADYGCNFYELSSCIPFINLYSGMPPLISVVTARSINSLRYIRNIGDEILRLNPDLVIFNSLITAVTSRYLSGKTKVICIDRETMTGEITKCIYRVLLEKYLDAITFLAEYERQKVGFTKTETIVFPDCMKMDLLVTGKKDEIRKHEGIDPDKYVILFMGGLSEIKGTDVILKAFDSLDNRFVLVMAGKVDEDKLSKKQLVHDLKYPGIFRFKKNAKKYYYRVKKTDKLIESGLRESIDELIIASDAVVFPSTSVHQPRPCIEAGAYCKPVILSDYDETKEFFIDGYNALTFKPGDAGDLVKIIEYAYAHKDKMEIIGMNNFHMTQKYHDFYDCQDRICCLIEKVCENAYKD